MNGNTDEMFCQKGIEFNALRFGANTIFIRNMQGGRQGKGMERGETNMEVTKPGSYSTYLYNITTGKLSTKTGEHDKFVDWYNGELSDDDVADELNGYDYNKKRDIYNLFHVTGSFPGSAVSRLCGEAGGSEVEVSYHVEDVLSAGCAINGKNVFEAYMGMTFTASELEAYISEKDAPFRTTVSEAYDPDENSISIAIGDEFDLGNGYRIQVKENRVVLYGDGNGDEAEKEKAAALCKAMDDFLHFTDQRYLSNRMGEEQSAAILEFLKKAGMDTGRKFVVNGTECEVREGEIRQVGNDHASYGTAWQMAMERIGKIQMQLLSEN